MGDPQRSHRADPSTQPPVPGDCAAEGSRGKADCGGSEQPGLGIPSGMCFLRPRQRAAQCPHVLSPHAGSRPQYLVSRVVCSCLLWSRVEVKRVGSYSSVALGELLYFLRPQFLYL